MLLELKFFSLEFTKLLKVFLAFSFVFEACIAEEAVKMLKRVIAGEQEVH